MAYPKVLTTPGQAAVPSPSVAAVETASGTAMPEINSSVRIPALDGLRGLAIFLVLVQHTVASAHFIHHPRLNWLLRLGRLSWSGVDLFFVLSGFLIGGILLDARNSPNYFKTFYIRRAYRILPLYLAVLIFGWLAFQAGRWGWVRGGWTDLFAGRVPWWTFFTFTQNIAAATTGPSGIRGVLSPTWSLAVEEQFYLTLPIIIRYASKRRLVQIVVLGFIAGAALLRVLVMRYFPELMPGTYILMPCRADALGLGVLAALMVREPLAWEWLRSRRKWIYVAATALGSVVVLICVSSFEPGSAGMYGAEYSILAIFYTLLLLIAVTGTDRFVNRVLCNQWLMRLGLIAYGTYLFHRFFLKISLLSLAAMGFSPSAGLFAAAIFLGVVGTIAAAQPSWTWFEKPLVRRGHRWGY